MKFGPLVAAALASLTMAEAVPDADASVVGFEARDAEEHFPELEARQTPTVGVGIPCQSPYKPGDYVCQYDSGHRKSYIKVCQIDNRWTFITWCPGVCYNLPGYPTCV